MRIDRESLRTAARGWWRKVHATKLLVLASVAAVTLGVISCATVERTILAPPQIPGATYMGSADCAQCHEEISNGFKNATHARLMARGENAKNVGCESCHGPGSIHDQAGGGRGNIVNPRRSPEVCFECHVDKRGELNLPYSHPVLEGKVSCTDCHDPNKGPAIKGGTMMASEQEVCGKCHMAQQGPFVFEHEAVREGCTTCHAVHGSVNAKMLVQRNANLCLKCHMQTLSSTVTIGSVNHNSNLNKGTCWTAGCHEAVHGSQVSTKLRF